jgi:Zn finger protein HypA/HybF involved in hydrogenase expression
MPELFEPDRAKARALLDELRAKINEASAGDEALRFQMKRYIAKRLEFDERGTPTHRRRLKAQKRESQRGLCASCEDPLPEHGAELHRARAIEGYTVENTSLLCPRCHANAEALAKLN